MKKQTNKQITKEEAAQISLKAIPKEDFFTLLNTAKRSRKRIFYTTERRWGKKKKITKEDAAQISRQSDPQRGFFLHC